MKRDWTGWKRSLRVDPDRGDVSAVYGGVIGGSLASSVMEADMRDPVHPDL